MRQAAVKRMGLRAARLALGALLLFASVMAWRFSLDGARRAQLMRELAQYRENTLLTGQSYADMRQVEERTASPCAFVLWNQYNACTLAEPVTGRQAQAAVLEAAGDTRLLLPSAAPLQQMDEAGCILDRGAARALFYGENAVGRQVEYAGRVYYVRQVVDAPQPVLLIPARVESLLPNVTMRGEGQLQAFGLRHGLRPSAVQYSLLANLSQVFSRLPLPCLLILLNYHAFLYNRRNRAFPLRQLAARLAVFAALTALAVCMLLLLPKDYIPSRWSDFGSYARTAREVGQGLRSFFIMEKTLPDLAACDPFFTSMQGLLSAILLLPAHAMLLPRQMEECNQPLPDLIS